jgi:hypothetical protein
VSDVNRLSELDSTSISIGFAAGAGMAGMTLNAAAGEDRAGRGRVGPGNVELGKAAAGKAAAGKAAAGKAETGKAEPGKAEPVTIGVPSDSSSRPRPWIVRS